jgi:hypothetical protein
MPSIPQSLLWISLVVLWLFVLVPMLISRRDAVRRTSDVALATRVLNTGRGARLLRRGRPAAGHRSDPDWQPSDDDLDDDLDEESHAESTERAVVRAAVVDTETDSEPDYLDVDVVDEDSGALPVGASIGDTGEDEESIDEVAEAEPEEFEEPQAQTNELPLDFGAAPETDEPEDEYQPDGTEDEYEYVADSSGLEAPSDTDLQLAESLSAARRRRYESKTAAAVGARKYKFRKRVLTVLAAVLVVSAAAAFTVAPAVWWACGAIGVVRPALRSGCGGDVPSESRGRGWVWRTPTTGSSTWFRRGCADPARWCWRSTTRTRSSSISTMPRSRAISICRARRASSRRFRRQCGDW